MVICLEQGADLHMAQLMPLPLTVSCFSKIQIGFTFLVPAHLGSPGQRAIKRVCVCSLCLGWLMAIRHSYKPTTSYTLHTTPTRAILVRPSLFHDGAWLPYSHSSEACCELLYFIYLYLITLDNHPASPIPVAGKQFVRRSFFWPHLHCICHLSGKYRVSRSPVFTAWHHASIHVHVCYGSVSVC